MSTLLAIFCSKDCASCGDWKRPHTAFCVACYGSLPKELKTNLWKRFGEGFEEAYQAAYEWLQKDRAETDRLLGEGA